MSEIKEIVKNKLPRDIIKNIRSMANYCYSCNRCVNVCPNSHLGIFNPRRFIIDLISLPLEDFLRNNNIWSCLTCGQCTIYCPMSQENTGVQFPELILKLRKLSVDNGIEIEKISSCETHDEIFPLISKMMAENTLQPNKLDFLEGLNLRTKANGDIAYFVGCIPLFNDIFYNLHIDYIHSSITIINLLNEAGIVPVVLNEKCCGHDNLWGRGDFDTFKKLAEFNVNLYRNAGVKTIIVGCAEGYRTWKYDYPKIIKNFDFQVLHFSEFFLKEKILEKMKIPQQPQIKVTYHDSCRIGRLGGKLYDAPREVIKQVPGVELIEMENIKDDALCCGVSAFMGCNECTRIIRQNRITEAVNTGASYMIVTCPKCLTHFNCYLNEPSLEEEYKELKNKINIIDLASFIGKILHIV